MLAMAPNELVGVRSRSYVMSAFVVVSSQSRFVHGNRVFRASVLYLPPYRPGALSVIRLR